jgi:hypothetical protein
MTILLSVLFFISKFNFIPLQLNLHHFKEVEESFSEYIPENKGINFQSSGPKDYQNQDLLVYYCLNLGGSPSNFREPVSELCLGLIIVNFIRFQMPGSVFYKEDYIQVNLPTHGWLTFICGDLLRECRTSTVAKSISKSYKLLTQKIFFDLLFT